MTQAQSKSYGGVKKKLMGAICMLLVASIMVVSSTYAWFTLSTAPEITGISTSVGANGNLEMALLTSGNGTDENPSTFEHLDKITSAVGDSAAKDNNVTRANLTWGNLVDLSNESYGLSDITLMPARLSMAADSTAEEVKANHTNLLQTASYGTDGRVKDIDINTVSAVKNGDGFQYTTAKQTYGVRAIGVASNVTPRQITFNNAKSAVIAAAGNAGNPFKTAVSNNFFYLALAAMQDDGNYSDEDIALMTEVATGAKTTLERITNAYAQAAIAAAAAKDSSKEDTVVDTLKGAISNITDASTLKTKLTDLGIDITSYSDQLDKIVTAQNSVKTALTALGGTDHSVATIKRDAAIPLIGGTDTIKGYNVDGGEMAALNSKTIKDAKTIHLTGGVAGTISEFTGNLNLGPNPITKADIIIGAKENTTNHLDTLKSAAERLQKPDGADTDTISDTYGYALDMAFRTNAAESKLQLAGDGVQRVYKNGTNTDTEGKGSTMTFKPGDGMKTESVQKLMEAIRVAFIDPETGKIYGVATLKNMKPGDDGTTGTLTLRDYQFTDGKLTVTDKNPASAELMDLPQNTAVRLTVVVWLDGDAVDNSMVANGAKSLTGSMNLQFSSSADLVPMENSALKNGTGTTGGGASQP